MRLNAAAVGLRRLGQPMRLLGFLGGLLFLAACLAIWRALSDSAGFFAPTFACVGSVALGLTSRGEARSAALGAALRVAGVGAALLAVFAALSLGVFLPDGVALWLSPALGRFGGGLALALLAAALGVRVLRAPRPDWLLDLLTLLLLAAGWIWTQTQRQVAFPPPPTGERLLTQRLAILLTAAVLLGLGVLLGRRSLSPGGRWCRRWGLGTLAIGLIVSLVAHAGGRWVLAILLLASLLVANRRDWPTFGYVARQGGWLLALVVAVALVYATTSEDLEIVLLRNTVEHRAAVFWRTDASAPCSQQAADGILRGVVRDNAGHPLAGASVVVADATGHQFSATSGTDGRYSIEHVPAGNYLPMAVAPGYRQGGRNGLDGRVATIRGARGTGGVDFRLSPRLILDPGLNQSLVLGDQTEASFSGLVNSTVLRRPFTFANNGLVLDGGLVHEPSADQGPGPFPILLIIYPGEAGSWEGVSAPLASEGYIVVSYFPRRILDLDGDLDDLRLLLNMTAANRLSARGDGTRIVLVGGSVSTVYIYLLARATTGAPIHDNLRALVQYGGLFDLFTFRQRWEDGQVIIDPGISELEYLLAAFGRPDSRPELYLRLSPRFGLGAGGLPPTLLTHAEKDIIVPPEQSHLAADDFAALHIPYELLLYPDLEHYLDVSKEDPAQLDMLERTVAFLRRWTR